MPSDPLLLFDPRRTIQLQGFSGRAATTTLHDATETGLQISGIFQAAEDFANFQLFSAYDYFNHLRVKPLPVTDLSGLTLQYDMEILPVNGEEGSVRPDCVRYASVGCDKLTITTGAGDIHEVPLMHRAGVVARGYAPGRFSFSLHDRDAEALDELLIGQPTPTLTNRACVHFMSTRWSYSSIGAIGCCNQRNAPAQEHRRAQWAFVRAGLAWQDAPNTRHYLLVNNGGAGIQEAGEIHAADTGSRLCSTLLSDPASRRRPRASLRLHLHPVVKGDFTLKLSNMPGTRNGKADPRGVRFHRARSRRNKNRSYRERPCLPIVRNSYCWIATAACVPLVRTTLPRAISFNPQRLSSWAGQLMAISMRLPGNNSRSHRNSTPPLLMSIVVPAPCSLARRLPLMR
jgi:hypothetical protein